MTKEIPLTKGAIALVDDSDYDWLMTQGRWSLSNKGYAQHWYKLNGQRKALLMHRLILSAPPHLHVDHINGNRLNNCRENLRLASRSENNANRAMMPSNSSGYRGVNRNRKHWEARIKYQNQRIYLGSFADAQEAALSYDAAARLLFADFAKLNFPYLEPRPQIFQAITPRLAKFVAV
jgi:hypothetical protein